MTVLSAADKLTQIPKFAYEYIPTGIRNISRPKKKWRDR